MRGAAVGCGLMLLLLLLAMAAAFALFVTNVQRIGR